RILHCTNVSCSTHDTPVTIEAGGVGLTPSIKIGTDGLPLIVYLDNSNDYLALLHCTKVSCSTHETPIPLDTTIPAFPSMAIGTDGSPVISYYDFANGDLKVLHRGGTILS